MYQDSTTPLYKYLVAKDTAVSVHHLLGAHKMYVIFGGYTIKTKSSKFGKCFTWTKFEILTEMTTKIAVFGYVILYRVVERYRVFHSILPLPSSVQTDEFASLFG